MNRKTNFTTTK